MTNPAAARLERALEDADALRFLPFVGPDYTGEDAPLLMLGEAAHAAPGQEGDRRLVQRTVKKALLDALDDAGNDHWVRYVRNIEAMLTGNPYGESSNTWNQLAYGVFLQQAEHAPGDHRHRNVAPEALEQARTAFLSMLDILKPKRVAAWGLTLYQHHWLADRDDVIMLDAELPAYALKSRPNIPVWHCHHPSRDFSYREEHKRWKAFTRLKLPRKTP